MPTVIHKGFENLEMVGCIGGVARSAGGWQRWCSCGCPRVWRTRPRVRRGSCGCGVVLVKRVHQRLDKLTCGVDSAAGVVDSAGEQLAETETPLGRGRVEGPGAYAGTHV